MGSSVNLGIAVVLTVLSLLAVALCFATDHWAMWMVQEEQMKNSADANIAQEFNKKPEYHTRHWGMFRVCFPSNNTEFLNNYQVVDGNCISMNYELPETAASVSKSENYWTRIHLLRCQFAFLVVGMLMHVFAFTTGTWACWKVSQGGSFIGGLCDLVGGLLVGGAMACFHGIDYLERNKIKDAGFCLTWPKALKDGSTFMLAWSYMLGWIACGLGLLGALFYLVESCHISSKKKTARRRKADVINRFLDYEDRRSQISTLPRSAITDNHHKKRNSPYEDNWENANRLVPVLVYDKNDPGTRY
ncbi:uncharacterized protein LOC141903902 [Tubulanus polymorphus]|uniref:uncharacterized protein LOC141903902 n=1 Tax=Tubulanus polymorphus TaxID=672921 RepID=UPI003DA2E7A8